MDDNKSKQMFISLVYTFQMQAMMQLGKIMNPVTNKVETELEGAQVTIDMLDMLKAKSKGNLSDDESKFIDQVIADLKLNFVEEKNQLGKSPDSKEEPATNADENTSENNSEPVKD